MLKEPINFTDGMPINILFTSIEEYPIHNHDALELIYVLEGEINLKLSYYNYTLTKGDIHIVNTEDIHSIYKKSPSNLLLILQIDLEDFKKYYNDIDKIIFVTESHYNKNYSEQIERIKQYLAEIMIVVFNKEKGYKKRAIELTNICLQNLINDFQYFTIEDKEFKNENKYKGDKLQIQRIYRITDYIYQNYMKKITLTQIAENEHISKYYLSHLIKYATGYGFQDFINFVRVEQSEYFLLGTNKLIGDISYECGFSSHRYYNKHFVKWFGITPSEYRKEYKNKTITNRKIKYLDLDLDYNEKDVLSKLKQIVKTNVTSKLRDISLNNNDKNIINIVEVAFNKKESSTTNPLHNYSINLSNIEQGLTQEYQSLLIKFQNEINFKYITLDNISNNQNINLESLNQFLNLLIQLKLTPIISIDYDNLKIDPNNITILLKTLFVNCINNYPYETINTWQIKIYSNTKNNQYESFITSIKQMINSLCLNIQVKEKSLSKINILNPLFDTHLMPCYIIDTILNNNDVTFIKNIPLVDDTTSYINNNSLFHGSNGLITVNGLTKASYYAYYFLSKLSNKIIDKSEDYIITRKNDNIQILLYNYDKTCSTKFINVNSDIKKSTKELYATVPYTKEFILRLLNVNNRYIIKRFKLDNCDFAYKHWANMGYPSSISLENKELIKKISFPKVSFSNIQPNTIQEIHIPIKPFHAELITFEKQLF